MKTKYKHIVIILITDAKERVAYSCHINNTGIVMGIVQIIGSNNKYFYIPAGKLIHSAEVMNDILNFCNQLNNQ